MRLRSLTMGTLLLAASLGSTAANADSGTVTMNFAVTRDGQQIGSNTIQLRHNGAETTVQMVTHVQVKIAFVTVYRFEQTETERWVDGQLMALNAVTDDNGTMHRVKATRTNDKLAIEADGKTNEVSGNTIPASLWNPLLLERTVAQDLVAADLQEGRRQATRVAVKRRGVRVPGIGAGEILRRERLQIIGILHRVDGGVQPA